MSAKDARDDVKEKPVASRDSGGGQRKVTQAEEDVDQQREDTASEVAARKEKLDEDIDAILDDIDEALEENAEEFVRGFVQKGGQ